MSVFNSFIVEVKDSEEVATFSLTLPKVINPHLGLCKVILFSNRKEGLYLALQNKINFNAIENKSYSEYINFTQFVQITRDYMLASGFRADNRKEFKLIHYKKLEDNPELDNQLLGLNLKWYPLFEVKQLLSPIEISFIEKINQPATFAVQK